MRSIALSAFADEASENFLEQLIALKEEGIPFIELRGLDGKNVSSLSESEAEDYARILRENEVRVWALGSPIGKIDINGDHGEHLKKAEHTFRLAKIFGTERIRAFSFFTANPESDEDKVFKEMEKLISLAYRSGVKLCHENEKGIYGDRVERVIKLKEKFPQLNLVFDPANYIQCDEDIDLALKLLYDKTDYFHIKDALYGGGEVVPAGEGDGKIARLISKIDREAVFTLEPHLKIFGGYAQIDDTELKNTRVFNTNREAFAFAVKSLKGLLKENGYKEERDKWIK